MCVCLLLLARSTMFGVQPLRSCVTSHSRIVCTRNNEQKRIIASFRIIRIYIALYILKNTEKIARVHFSSNSRHSCVPINKISPGAGFCSLFAATNDQTLALFATNTLYICFGTRLMSVLTTDFFFFPVIIHSFIQRLWKKIRIHAWFFLHIIFLV